MIRALARQTFLIHLDHNIISKLLKPPPMSALRRRIFGSGGDDTPVETPEPSREGSPVAGQEYKVVPAKEVEKSKAKKPKSTKRRNIWMFGLGGLFGIVVAGAFASSNEFMDLAYLKDMNLDSIFDVLPAGLIQDAQALQVCD